MPNKVQGAKFSLPFKTVKNTKKSGVGKKSYTVQGADIGMKVPAAKARTAGKANTKGITTSGCKIGIMGK